MIKGVHAMYYSPQADTLRAFLRDQLGLPFVDTGGGWLIFNLHDVEVAAHPAAEARHQFSFYCDDLRQTMTELAQRGVEFIGGVSEQDWGWLTHFNLPGGEEAELYQSKYAAAGARPAAAAAIAAASWQEFAAAAPELSDFAFDRLYQRIAYLATVTAEGAPRVHPVSPFFGGGRLFVYMEPSSPKVRDLARDPRFSLHATVEDNDGGNGELSVSGRARVQLDPAQRQLAFASAREAGQSPEERYVVFELHLERVLTTTYALGKPLRRRWAA